MAIDPRGIDLKRFLAEDDGGAFVMLNLLRFAEGRSDQYDEYARQATRFVKRYGGEPLYFGSRSTVLVAEPGQDWDAVMLVRYPSREAFSRMVADPEYQAISHLRTGALTEAVLQATTPRPGSAQPAGVTIRIATNADIPRLLDLESRYYVGNLDPSQRSEGFISVLHPRQWFERTIAADGLHVAVVDDNSEGAVLVGFIAVSEPPPPATPGLDPFTAAMIDLAQTVEFNGAKIAAQRYALRGPVLIDSQARGRGVYSAFNAVTAQHYRDRFDVGVLFVSAENPRSLHTTTTKLGATALAEFEVDGKGYHLLAFAFHPQAGSDVASRRLDSESDR